MSRRWSPYWAWGLLLALSGTAVALPGSNNIMSGDIRNGAVKSADVKNNDVRGKDVRTNTLKGSDIDESSLARVPSANTANSANTADRATLANRANGATVAGAAVNAANALSINGTTVRSFRYSVNADDPPQTVLNLAGLALEASCPGGDLDVEATASADGSLLSAGETAGNSIEVYVTSGNSANLLPASDDDEVGHTEWSADTGSVMTINWQADDALNFDCQFAGTAVGTG